MIHATRRGRGAKQVSHSRKQRPGRQRDSSGKQTQVKLTTASTPALPALPTSNNDTATVTTRSFISKILDNHTLSGDIFFFFIFYSDQTDSLNHLSQDKCGHAWSIDGNGTGRKPH